jgi:hypothetical protein
MEGRAKIKSEYSYSRKIFLNRFEKDIDRISKASEEDKTKLIVELLNKPEES